jgi:glutaconate CoA-transferase subunit A
MGLVRELLRSDVRDLTVVAYGGADVGLLCAAGKVKKVVFAFVSLDFMPLEPAFRKARESGAIEVREVDEGMMLLGLRAAAWGESLHSHSDWHWDRCRDAKSRPQAG